MSSTNNGQGGLGVWEKDVSFDPPDLKGILAEHNAG
jgi:hypothetical protein